MGLAKVTCTEVTCDRCGYRLDEDGDGVFHLPEAAPEALKQLRESHAWVVTPAGRIFCEAEDCIEQGRRESATAVPPT